MAQIFFLRCSEGIAKQGQRERQKEFVVAFWWGAIRAENTYDVADGVGCEKSEALIFARALGLL